MLPPDRALHQDIRERCIGLLNMMPDKALAATERQFFRLVGESNPIAQFYAPVHAAAVASVPRRSEHVDASTTASSTCATRASMR